MLRFFPYRQLFMRRRRKEDTGAWGFSTAVGQSYTIQRNPELWTTNWVTYTNFIGDGLWRNFLFPPASPPSDFFRVLEPPN